MSDKKDNKTPIERRAFDALGKAIHSEEPKPSFVGKLFSRWLTPPERSDWSHDAKWAQMQQEPIKARAILYLIVGVFLSLIVWAGFAEVDEVARGEGRVIPSQQLQIVQSYDGGKVEDILIREGQVVAKDDLLLKIDPTRFESNLKENRSQYLSLSAEAAKLRALTQGSELTFPLEVTQEAPDIAQMERNAYASKKQEMSEQMAIYRSQLRQREQDVKEAKAALSQYQQSLALSNRELTVTKPLLASGAVSDIDIIRLERQIVEIEGEINRTQAVIERGEAAIEEAQNKINEVKLNMENRWKEQLSEVVLRLEALRQTESGLADKVKETELRSPVRGTIHRLHYNTVGGIIQPGSDVIEIIPLDDQLIIEARIAPKDIAFLRPKQPATIKFTAYDFAIYGGLDAEVTHISADTITDERDNTYYLVRLKTKKNRFKDQLTIIPGMTTQVDIITGKKTVLSYLIKPILRATSQALSER